MKKSAGILLFRRKEKSIEFFLVHPGGPFWKGKEKGAWSIPKGEFDDTEDPLVAAKREFQEETGMELSGEFLELELIQQKGGKLVYAWATEGDLDAKAIVSNHFSQEWPYRSGNWKTFPEVDKAGWFSYEQASNLINPAQSKLLEDLINKLSKH